MPEVPVTLVPPRPPVRVALTGSPRLRGEVLAWARAQDPRLVVVAEVVDPARLLRAPRGCRPEVVVLALPPAGGDPLADLAAFTAGQPGCPVLGLATAQDDQVVARALACGARGVVAVDSSLAELADAVVAVAGGATVVPGRQLTGAVRSLSYASPVSTWPDSLIGYLTPRELEILRLLAAGRSTYEVAASLGITTHTTRTHVQNLLAKLGLSSRLAAAAFAVRHGVC